MSKDEFITLKSKKTYIYINLVAKINIEDYVTNKNIITILKILIFIPTHFQSINLLFTHLNNFYIQK